MQNVKAIPGECQHVLVLADIEKKKIMECSRKDKLAVRFEDEAILRKSNLIS